jgi:hypothetical protein
MLMGYQAGLLMLPGGGLTMGNPGKQADAAKLASDAARWRAEDGKSWQAS